MGRQRREFAPEYKDEAVKLVVNTGRAVARELGINEATLGRWVNAFKARQDAGEPALSETERAALARLRKENSELRMDRAFLKKASASSRPSAARKAGARPSGSSAPSTPNSSRRCPDTSHPTPRQPSLDLPALDQAIGGFIAEYNDRTHSEVGASPKTAWIAGGWLPRMPDRLDELDGLLLTVPKHRTVQRDGIHFQGHRYLSPTLAPFVGRPVTIRYDPRDALHHRMGSTHRGRRDALRHREPIPDRLLHPRGPARNKELMREIEHLQGRVGVCVDEHQRHIGKVTGPHTGAFARSVELLIIDEAERLTPTALELLRDQHDATNWRSS